MGSPAIHEKPYGAAMSGDWKSMIDYYDKDHFEYFLSPVTHSWDTVLHLAVHSNKKRPLKDLLEIMKEKESPLTEEEFLKIQNKFGNTVLHEATIYGNYEAVRLLVKRCPDLISIPNNYGETPLFTAAGSGEAEIVEFLVRSKPKQCLAIVDDKKRLLSIHTKRSKDDLSILGAAIIGQHFETALFLLELDESLHSLKDKNGITALQLLAHTPSAFKSGFPMGIFERLIYCCLPVRRKVEFQVETSGQARKGTVGDVESGLGSSLERKPRGGLLNYFKVPKGCWLEGFWKQKRKHVFALRLAEILIEKDESWNKVDQNKKGENEFPAVGQTSENTSKGKDRKEPSTAKNSVTKSSLIRKEEIPLLIATRNGIEEIVGEIIKQHPHAIEQLNDEGQSILDVAVMHRQEEIFSLVKEQKIPLARLHRNIDSKGNTLLHNVAVMTEHSGATKPGPALQLQEALQWYEHVHKVIPSHYVTLLNEDGKTAWELFKDNHKEQLHNARTWIKETTQSCSTVAALVATVVFAAAYTVPGGSDAKGKPNFINSPYFLAFTVSDVLSLASSLTSLVVFLSLLTSPFELKDFHISLPRKLILGFTFLFLAVITTMISFGATILILIQTESKLTTLLLSFAAFFPVSIFAIMQFRLYVSFMSSTFNIIKNNGKALPSIPVPCLPWGEMLGPKKKKKNSI
ncbi:protein ACCELERATED CELL DEATH 6-like [Populus alba x Populus x berolinensis]|nr:protein ACCELERATED CELL DEATH 6-like [Populus alba x Populus x berolinensis]